MQVCCTYELNSGFSIVFSFKYSNATYKVTTEKRLMSNDSSIVYAPLIIL